MMSHRSTRRSALRLGASMALGAAAWPVLAAAERTFRIGFQKGGGLLALLKAQGKLERSLQAEGWGLTWHEFPAGPQLLEALNAGSIDFGYTGAPPPVFAQAAGKDIVYVGAEPSGPSVEAIVVKSDSAIRRVADLKGKRVAFQKGSSSNFLAVAALTKAGLPYSEIQAVYLPPADARAAFESDRVDAWVIWDPYLASIQATQKVRVLADYTGLAQTNSFYESSRAFTVRAPQQLALVLAELARAGAWATANPSVVAEQLSQQLGLPKEILETWQKRAIYGARPIDAGIIARQQAVADAFLEQGLIPKKIEVASAVWNWQKA